MLERVEAIPYAIEGDVLKRRDPDPGTSTRSTNCESRRGSDRARSCTRDDIQAEISGSVRTSEASVPCRHGGRAALRELAVEDADDLEVDDGVSDAPLVRLVNSVIFQAAEDGASDIHFEPQEDALVVRLRIDGVLQEVQRIPKRLAAGVTDPSEGAREARHRRAP